MLQQERHRFLGANPWQANLPPAPFHNLLSLLAASFPRENSYLRSWVCLNNTVQVTPQHGYPSPKKSRHLHWLGVSLAARAKGGTGGTGRNPFIMYSILINKMRTDINRTQKEQHLEIATQLGEGPESQVVPPHHRYQPAV